MSCMDNLTKEERHWNMSRVRASGTEFEKTIFKELRARGLSFQTNYTRVIGKPDIAKPKEKKAIFLHSDFWHGWQFPRWQKKLPNRFWREKIRKNRARDRKVLRILRGSGWRVMVVWEHSLKRNQESCVEKMAEFLRSS